MNKANHAQAGLAAGIHDHLPDRREPMRFRSFGRWARSLARLPRSLPASTSPLTLLIADGTAGMSAPRAAHEARNRELKMNIESLESRIAPAILFTYTELDGDLVTVTISKGSSGDATFTHPQVPGTFGDQLQMINLNGNPVFKGANITVSAKQQDLTGDGLIRGDGLANIGFIDASGIDLGAVKIKGDLAKILAGDATLTTPGLSVLQVLSLGRFGTATGAPNTASDIQGKLGKLTVTTDLVSFITSDGLASATIATLSGTLSSSGDMGFVKVSGTLAGFVNASGKLAGVSVGGSFTTGFGQIFSGGDMGLIRIAGDLRVTGNTGGGISSGADLAGVKIGGSFVSSINSGAIISSGDMGLIEIRGDIRGGPNGGAVIISSGNLAGMKVGGTIVGGGDNSANIRSSGDMGPVRIGGSLIGERGDNSATISSDGDLTSVSIGGSIIGGQANFSGQILSGGPLGALKIAGDLLGRAPVNGGDPSLDGSGYVEGQRIGSVSIRGSIVAGFDFNATDAPTQNASIRARDDIGSLVVKGSLIGNTNGDDVEVIIAARGKAGVGPDVKTDVAIGKITIGGGMTLARILAGFDPGLAGANADAQIGAVTIGGNVLASNIIAGVQPGADGFGNFNDAKISEGSFKDNADGLGAISRIASIVIKGHALGSLASDDDAVFGIEAQHLGTIKVGGVALFLRPAPGNDLFNVAGSLGPTRTPSGDGFDFHAFEVPLT